MAAHARPPAPPVAALCARGQEELAAVLEVAGTPDPQLLSTQAVMLPCAAAAAASAWDSSCLSCACPSGVVTSTEPKADWNCCRPVPRACQSVAMAAGGCTLATLATSCCSRAGTCSGVADCTVDSSVTSWLTCWQKTASAPVGPAGVVDAGVDDVLAADELDALGEPPPLQAVSTATATARTSPATLTDVVRCGLPVRCMGAGYRPAHPPGYGSGVDAPADPRASWALPAPGALPRTAELEPLVTRVLAPNPSAMTLDGTNTYLVGAPGSGQAVLVDPGPDDAAHLAAVEQAVAERNARCVAVLVTHHHGDHAEAAVPWGARFGAQVGAARPDVAGPGGRVLAAGERLRLAGTAIDVVPTPGHTGDHLAFRLESGAVLVGDHVLGRGTSVVTHPEGDVVAYLESLRRVHDLGPSALYCGHGPELTDDPGAVLTFYLEHRAYREAQIVAGLAAGAGTVDDLVAAIYADYPRDVWPAAAQSTSAALDKLVAEGRVEARPDGSVRLA
jgi:glyoxylase-like metal-dependent hydrolase (beta-lactamase superfamily II)